MNDLGIKKDCGACGEPLMRRQGESAGAWRKRKTCNRICGQRLAIRKRYGDAHAAMQHLIEIKKCSVCEGGMKPHKRETVGAFEKRDVCSRSCANVKKWRDPNKRPWRHHVPKPKPAKKAQPKPPPQRKPFTRFPEVVRQQEVVAAKFTPQFEAKYCEVHPGELLSAWGLCAACTAGGRWAERERSITARPFAGSGGR